MKPVAPAEPNVVKPANVTPPTPAKKTEEQADPVQKTESKEPVTPPPTEKKEEAVKDTAQTGEAAKDKEIVKPPVLAAPASPMMATPAVAQPPKLEQE